MAGATSLADGISVQRKEQNFKKKYVYVIQFPFSSLTLWLGGRKGIRPVKNWVVGCWHGYLSGARCRLAYGPADATATHCLYSVKSRLVLPFWYWLTQVVPEKGPLNGCVCYTICTPQKFIKLTQCFAGILTNNIAHVCRVCMWTAFHVTSHVQRKHLHKLETFKLKN